MEETGVEKVICGTCGGEWPTNAEYLAHVCPVTGWTPTDPAHLGPEFLHVQKSALQRGMEQLVESGDEAGQVVQQAAIDEVAGKIASTPAQPNVPDGSQDPYVAN